MIEMLIVSITLGVISLAINSALNNGVKIWRKINQHLPQEDIDIFLDKLTLDLHNVFLSPQFTFTGDQQRLALPTLVTSAKFPDRLPGEALYVYDESKNQLDKQIRDYSDIYNDDQGLAQPLLKNLNSLKFSYYFFEAEKKYYSWVDEWKNEGLPNAVRVEIEVKDGDKIRQFSRTIAIPVAS